MDDLAPRPDPAKRALLAALPLPDHCVVVDRSAAHLYGIGAFHAAELDVGVDVEVASIAGATATRREGVLGGKRDLLPEEVTVVEGIRVTTPLRTVCDLACLRGRRRAIGLLDAFRKEFGISEADLASMLPRFVGRRGVTQLRELIPLSRPEVDSQPESWIRIDIHDEGLPMPESQVWVWVDGWGRAKIENAYPHLRIAVEYDGEEFHSSDDDRARDAARRAALRRAGWVIIVVRREGLTGPGREVWLSELKKAYADRAPAPPAKRVYARSPNARVRRSRRR